MLVFRTFLAGLFLIFFVYTAIVIWHHGLGLLPIFFGDMATMGWPGQFNLDFMGFLALSALWVSWRQHFSSAGLGLGVIAFFGGIGFLAPYLFFLSFKETGDMAAILLGRHRANAVRP